MKCVKAVCVIVTVLALTGASVWEGAAAVAPDGQLPATGYYVATNSFPTNTVVDITNLENDKSVRVVVAAGLESPGLLAVLSGNTAALIGLRNGAVGRIKMSQPSDPVAFSRFTEGMASYGEPDYTASIPMTESAAYTPPAPPAPEPAPFIGSRDPAPAPPVQSDTGRVIASGAANGATTGSTGATTGTASGTAPGAAIGAFPGSASGTAPGAVPGSASGTAPSAATGTATGAASNNTASFDSPAAGGFGGDSTPPARFFGGGVTSATAPEPEWEEYPYEKVMDIPGAAYPAEWYREPPATASPPSVASATTPERQEIPASATEQYDFTLVPAEDRPPESITSGLISPEDIIPAIGSAGRESGYASIPPIPADNFVAPVMPEKGSIAHTPPEVSFPAEEHFIAHAPAEERPPFPVAPVSGLEWGKYYVQIAAFNRPELIESALSRIGGNYPLTIQNAGSDTEPVYRLLLGPLNQGESGAMLQRMKSIGYTDAFVRGH
jgi:hypothetical protein